MFDSLKKSVRWQGEENEKGNGEHLGSGGVGPALQPVSERLQTHCQGQGEYQVWREKQRSEDNGQWCGGVRCRAPAPMGGGCPNLTRKLERGCRASSCTWGAPHVSTVFKALHYPSGKITCLNLQ